MTPPAKEERGPGHNFRVEGRPFWEMVSQSIDAFTVTDQAGIITYMSPAAERMFGYTQAEMEGQHFSHFLYPEEWERARRLFLEAIQKGATTGRVELRFQRRDGSVFPGELHATLFHSGDFSGTFSVIQDISSRKQMEEALRENEERYRTLFENASDMILVYEITPDQRPGKIIDANSLACEALGYTKDELVGMPLADISGPSDLEEGKRIAWEMATNHHALFEGTAWKRDGMVIPH